jgi:hypothetical protein
LCQKEKEKKMNWISNYVFEWLGKRIEEQTR